MSLNLSLLWPFSIPRFASDLDVTYQELMAVDNSEGLYDGTYVVHYDYGSIEQPRALEEFRVLLDDILSAGLKTEVRAGPDKSLLVIVRVPEQLLGRTVYKSRVKDWLYGVTQKRPEGNKDTAVLGETESENLRSVYHLLTWKKQLGGAGITPQIGKWGNVKSVYPLHNRIATKVLLLKWSRQLILREEDLDQIRALFGEKVAFYFAFLQTYLIALVFPSVTGVLGWLYLPEYSLIYAITTSLWCIVFLEYWKLREVDLSLRWSVKGVGSLKINRIQFTYDKELIDPITGESYQHFSRLKQVVRQFLQIPFATVAMVSLGALITVVFAIEVFISEVYNGPFKFYLEYLPTVLLAILLPFISSMFEGLASSLTEYENHRTEDRHEMALTQKIFVLSSITKYLPIFLTAFVYVPFGDVIVAWGEAVLDHFINDIKGFAFRAQFTVNASRLRNEVIALVVTEQLLGFGEELILPVLKRKATRWYGERKAKRSNNSSLVLDSLNRTSIEAGLPTQARNESELAKYNVQDDIQEMVVQFGYLALFSPVWPLIPVGFLINNWIELRSDFLKICIEHQRPPPIRADSIGPWLDSLSFLTWLGSISTAAIVYLFKENSLGQDSRASSLYALAATIFVSEHIYLAVRYIVRISLARIGSVSARKELREQYARRKHLLDEFQIDMNKDKVGDESQEAMGQTVSKSVEVEAGNSSQSFGLCKDESGRAQSIETGIRLIRSMGERGEIKKDD